jgi:Arabinose efflux permease
MSPAVRADGAWRDPAARFGLVASLCSGFGQTYFIGLFGGALRTTLGVSAGDLGALYAAATLASGTLMFWLGAHADRASPRAGITLALTLLTLGCVLLAVSVSPWMLLPAFFALRLGGQGLSGHYAIVAASRMTAAQRGRGVAVATFGFIVGEALWPNLAGRLLEVIDWRLLWIAAAALAALVLLPTARGLAARIPAFVPAPSAHATLTRRWLLRQPSFYAALGVLLVSPLVITAFLFQQTALGAARGWSPALIASAFLVYAAAQALTNLASGPLVDRRGVLALVRVQLLPAAAGMACFAAVPGWGPLPVFAGLGATAGFNNVSAGVLWPALYGERQLGLVRGVFVTVMVAATAVSPALLGWALDAGASAPHIAAGVTLYALLAAPLLAPLLRRQIETISTPPPDVSPPRGDHVITKEEANECQTTGS